MQVEYLIGEKEMFGNRTSGTKVTGILKAYDKCRKIGLIMFTKHITYGCACYVLAKKNEDGVFVTMNKDTWVNAGIEE